MSRWLLPLLAVLALTGQAVMAYAAAGVIGESSCCCPDPSACKCHDHDGKPDASANLKRCGGEAKLVPLAVAVALPAIATEPSTVLLASSLPPDNTLPLPDGMAREPAKPPF